MSSARGRLVFAGVLAAGLVIAASVVALSGSSGGNGEPDPCIAAWNGDAIARSDGSHAYNAHGYRATLVTRVDRSGGVIAADEIDGPPSPEQRCAVIFAAAEVRFEPDFGVRVLDSGRWAGLAAVDGISPDEIVAIQTGTADATNATLFPDGRLAD